MLLHMGCIKVYMNNYIQMHDKPHTFLTIVDQKTYTAWLFMVTHHKQVRLLCVRSFKFSTGN